MFGPFKVADVAKTFEEVPDFTQNIGEHWNAFIILACLALADFAIFYRHCCSVKL